jgi:hypothetical protein
MQDALQLIEAQEAEDDARLYTGIGWHEMGVCHAPVQESCAPVGGLVGCIQHVQEVLAVG